MEVTSISSFKNKEHRLETNQNIIQFQQALKSGASQRQAEKLTNWPRQNFSYWNQRLQRAELDPVVADFFLQQEGVEFLNRISLAAEFVISQLCGGGTGAIQTFYELTKLDQLIASSDGSVHQRLVRLENNLIEFGKQQASQASNNLPEKEINCAMDETFPSDICLVGMDTDSGFILVEKLDRKRDFDTWNKAMEEALSPYSPQLKVRQVVSDGAKALIKCARETLGAEHAPDLFHIQQEIIRGTTPQLKARIKTTESRLEKACASFQQKYEQRRAYQQQSPKPVGRPVEYDRHVYAERMARERAEKHLKRAVIHQEEVKEAIRGIGQDYHPFDLETGRKRSPQKLREDLNRRFSLIEKHAENAEISENGIKKINKAKRNIESLVTTLTMFWSWVLMELKALNLSAEMASVFENHLLPLAYIELRSEKEKRAARRKQLRMLYRKMYSDLCHSPLWGSLSREEQSHLLAQARKCARLFQRSSSCVEGRNGQLSLKHHSRKVNPRQLSASTVIHNYFIRRSDGTTAAQRFFEQKHNDLFSWLLDNTDYPALPAQKRLAYCKLAAVA